jgi:hypothetical protein
MMSIKLVRYLSLALIVGLVFAAGCHHYKKYPKKAGERTWTALDAKKPPGAPTEVILDKGASDATKTTFELSIPGFWVEEKQGPDGRTYQKIEIPGLGSVEASGAPDLPTLRFDLAVPTNAQQATLEAELIDVQSFPNSLIWPQVVPQRDHPEGNPERFILDQKIYDSRGLWPPADGREASRVAPRLRSIPAAQGEVWPVRWNPATRELRIAARSRYTVRHAGESLKLERMTKERGRLAELTFLNWRVVQQHFPIEVLFYDAEFLILYPDAGYADELAPFAAQKRARGFRVTERTLDQIGSTCQQIRSAIANWEAAVPASRDAYALLVGDVDEIPLCTSPAGDPTDDLYGSPSGNDLSEEVYVGRLSVDSETDAANQISKILAYEDHPSLFCCYNQVGLWAHKEDAPGKYVGAHETVRTGSYAVPPVFDTYYGHQAGVTDSDINGEVDSGVGVLAYRGHGSETATATGWNQASEFYDSGDATTLANPVAQSPVVWSFACSNAGLSTADAISEIWMEQPDRGAVSYYGATVPSWTDQNHVLDEWMFKAVYDEGLVTQAHAIERAEAQMAALSGSDNAWMYLLLGDPDLQIRRRNPVNLRIDLDRQWRSCPPPCRLELTVVDQLGRPVPEALVGLWKAGPRGGDEIFVNRYADKNGRVTLETTPTTAGKLFYAVEDGQGNALFGSLEVDEPKYGKLSGSGKP